jgi:hypothetical protein
VLDKVLAILHAMIMLFGLRMKDRLGAFIRRQASLAKKFREAN